MIQIEIKNLDKINERIEQYRLILNAKINHFVVALADEGVYIAKLKISEYDAIYTGELLSSIDLKPGDTFQYGSQWIVYTGCPWAKYVEFGTGLVGGRSQHYDAVLQGWRYDVNQHGEAGWSYYRDGSWHRTKGMPSRPFMYETAQEMRLLVAKKAKEVFGL